MKKPIDRMSLLWDIKKVSAPNLLHVHMSDAAKEEITSWPYRVKKDLGSVLTLLQLGTMPGLPDVRQMPNVGKGVAEIRIGDASGEYRAFFVIKTKHGVIVFHAFKKKSRKTPQKEIEIGEQRLKRFLEELGL